MKHLTAGILTFVFGFCLFAGTSSAEQTPACDTNGAQTSINGQTHTCGTCATGGGAVSAVWFVGDLSGARAEHGCKCMHDKTYDCAANSRRFTEKSTTLPMPEPKK